MTLSTNITDFASRVGQYLSDQIGTGVDISRMQPLAGGASRDSWAFTATIDGQPQRMVLRRDLPTTMNQDALSRQQEYRLMQAAYDSGVKVAKMRFECSDAAVLGYPFFIMDFVDGVSIGRKVVTMPELAQARETLPEQMAEQLALIHRMDPGAHRIDFLRAPTPGQSPVQGAIQQMYKVMDSFAIASPGFEFALRWAVRHAPQNRVTSLVHGDFRMGNVLVDANGLTAVIDWEFAHIGDPLEEIGYLCMRDWRFGNDHLHAAGLCPRERFIKAYETYSGMMVDRSVVDWWEIMGNIRWGIICLVQAERYLSGQEPSVEFASLGRRSVEMQLEALRLIQKVEQAK